MCERGHKKQSGGGGVVDLDSPILDITNRAQHFGDDGDGDSTSEATGGRSGWLVAVGVVVGVLVLRRRVMSDCGSVPAVRKGRARRRDPATDVQSKEGGVGTVAGRKPRRSRGRCVGSEPLSLAAMRKSCQALSLLSDPSLPTLAPELRSACQRSVS